MVKIANIRKLIEDKEAILYSYLDDKDKDLIQMYFSVLAEQDKNKILRLLEKFASKGEIKNKEKFKFLQGSNRIFEFKSYQHRLLCFYLPDRTKKSLILTHGFQKQRGKTPSEQISKAERIQNILLVKNKNNELIIMEE